jgi:nucleoid-associated protein YgaU
MTSDAKIGLLLGLVFIFIIAFIINGLPKLRGQTDSNELTTNMVRNDPPGLGAWERKADEVLNPPPQAPQRPLFDPARTFSTDDADVRHSFPLTPGILGRQNTAENVIGPIGPELVSGERQSVSPPAAPYDRQTEPKTTELKPIDPLRPTETAKSIKPSGLKTYVVSSGDTLATIAKKFYGSEEGNKRANVAMIFEANRKLLKSADEVFVGQEIVIPALPAVASVKAPGSGLLSGPLFEPVKSIGQKNLSTAAESKESGRFYVVKEGDSLWKISTEQLGSGIRYKEINTLNAGALTSEDDLSVGMRLKIPPK